MNFIKWPKEWSGQKWYAYVLVSHPPPTRFFETRFTGHILLILRSVHVNAADLHVIYYSVNCTTSKRCLTR